MKTQSIWDQTNKKLLIRPPLKKFTPLIVSDQGSIIFEIRMNGNIMLRGKKIAQDKKLAVFLKRSFSPKPYKQGDFQKVEKEILKGKKK